MKYNEIIKWAEENKPSSFYDISEVDLIHRDGSSFTFHMASFKIKDQWIVVWSKNHPTSIYRRDELVCLTTLNESEIVDGYVRYLDELDYVEDYDPYEEIRRS